MPIISEMAAKALNVKDRLHGTTFNIKAIIKMRSEKWSYADVTT
jgi:hypothetical protein